MNSGDVSGAELTKLSKEYSHVAEILPLVDEYFATKQGISDATEMQHDAELRDIAAEQLENLKHALPDIEKRLQIALLPRDDADDNSAIMEIRAGVGGEESALFAGDYTAFAAPDPSLDLLPEGEIIRYAADAGHISVVEQLPYSAKYAEHV